MNRGRSHSPAPRRRGKSKSVSTTPTHAQRGSSSSVLDPTTGALRPVRARSKSMPTFPYRQHLKGILKYSTADMSLHSTYGATTTTISAESKDSESSSQQRRNNNHTIEFKEIHIREYARTIGDNPSCSNGAPIAISWDYDPDTKILSVDQYEDNRPPRRSHYEMILPRDVRHAMLRHEWEITQAQIAAAVRNNLKAKNQRRTTVNNLDKASKMEELLESAGRKVKRILLFQKTTTRQVQELEEKMAEINRLRAQMYLESEMAAEYSETPSEQWNDRLIAGTSTTTSTGAMANNINNSFEAKQDKHNMSPEEFKVGEKVYF